MIRRRRRPHAGTSVTRSSAFEKTTLATEIARHLREAIISGELAPGERVNELKLTRKLALMRSQAEHESILGALEQRRVDQGVALVTAHITNLKEAVLKAMVRTA